MRGEQKVSRSRSVVTAHVARDEDSTGRQAVERVCGEAESKEMSGKSQPLTPRILSLLTKLS